MRKMILSLKSPNRPGRERKLPSVFLGRIVMVNSQRINASCNATPEKKTVGAFRAGFEFTRSGAQLSEFDVNWQGETDPKDQAALC